MKYLKQETWNQLLKLQQTMMSQLSKYHQWRNCAEKLRLGIDIGQVMRLGFNVDHMFLQGKQVFSEHNDEVMGLGEMIAKKLKGQFCTYRID